MIVLFQLLAILFGIGAASKYGGDPVKMGFRATGGLLRLLWRLMWGVPSKLYGPFPALWLLVGLVQVVVVMTFVVEEVIPSGLGLLLALFCAAGSILVAQSFRKTKRRSRPLPGRGARPRRRTRPTVFPNT